MDPAELEQNQNDEKPEQPGYDAGEREEELEEEVRNGPALVKALKSNKDALKQTKEKLRSYEQKVSTYESIIGDADPKEVERWKRASEQAEQQEMLRAKKYEELTRMKDDQITQLSKSLAELQDQLITGKIDRALEDAFYEAGGKKGHFKAVRPALMPLAQLADDGTISIVRPDGTRPVTKDGKVQTVAEFLNGEYRDPDNIYSPHFEPRNTGYGMGATPMSRASIGQASMKDRLNSIADPATKRQLAREQGYTE